MGILKKRTPWEQEFRAAWKEEQRFLQQYEVHRETLLEQKLGALAPEQLTELLHTGFEKAFTVLYEKGAGRSGLEKQRETYRIQTYAAELREDRRRLRAFTRSAGWAGGRNVLVSGAAGIGMGLFGAALPDIPLFAALTLRSVYGVGESYGFSCQEEAERLYALRIIETALSYGTELRQGNARLERFEQTGVWQEEPERAEQLHRTARNLSAALLCGKALQNIPVAGAAGGAGDAVCLRRIQRYACIRYRKRFLLCRRLAER